MFFLVRVHYTVNLLRTLLNITPSLQFSDLLLYTNRSAQPSAHFRVHGAMQAQDLSVLDSDPRMGAEHCFNIYDGKRALLVAASSPHEKALWMEDITEAAQVSIASVMFLLPTPSAIVTYVFFLRPSQVARAQQGLSPSTSHPHHPQQFMSLKSISGSEDGLDRNETANSSVVNMRGANSSVHVCWHRCTTLSAKEQHDALQTALSGYLLRKFKNSDGWQKLWVVFAASCLFFFKTFQVTLCTWNVQYDHVLCDSCSKDRSARTGRKIACTVDPAYNTTLGLRQFWSYKRSGVITRFAQIALFSTFKRIYWVFQRTCRV